MYEQKDQEYFNLARTDVLPMVPVCQRLLDVGCGSGATSAMIKQQGICSEAVGIELFEDAATVARTRLDRVITGDISTMDLPFEDHSFDVILCLDVLEHTVDPWSVLRKLRRLIKPGGVLIASIPNIAFAPVILKILCNRFAYEDSGVLDRTHLRFFTLHTIRELFEQSGYTIQRIERNRARGWKILLFTLCTAGLGWLYSTVQFRIVAVPNGHQKPS
jgi:2-polyprenyl-3-methyl-5-hydroxy-6-metoxy-1,4-benzoquinol methylase